MENFNAEVLLKEVEFRFTRSGGKGGQNVNKVATKAELYFNVNESKQLLPEQKEILLEKLATRLSTNGVLKIASQEARSQLENKEKVSRKFIFFNYKSACTGKAKKGNQARQTSKGETIEGEKNEFAFKEIEANPY